MIQISLQRLTYKKRCQILMILCALAIGVIFLRGLRLDLVSNVTDRLRYHAIPIAISVLYHNHPHDYTGIREVCIPFQAPGKLQNSIGNAVEQKVESQNNYFWVADDKGFEDFVIGAFALFGPKLTSLYLFWFVCLGLSAGVFAASYKKNMFSLCLLALLLAGVHAAVSVLPLADEANFLGGQPFSSLSGVSIYEPRFFDVLALIPLLHIILFTFKKKWPPTKAQLFGLVFQFFFFFFLYHSRSSLGWQIVALVAVVALALAPAACRKFSSRKVNWKGYSSALLVLGLLVVSIVSLNVYKRVTYNARYYNDMGVRTFWHNALMGLKEDRYFTTTYGIDYSDLVVAQAVIKYAQCNGTCEQGVDKLEGQLLLNSLGGHGNQDWFAYEDCAKKFYFHIWRTETLRMFRLYLLVKPKMAIVSIVHSLQDSRVPLADATRARLDIGFYPLSGYTLAIGLLACLVAYRPLYRNRRLCAMLFGVLCCASFIPSLSFYAAILTMGGVYVTLTIVSHLLLFHGLRMFSQWAFADSATCRKH